LVLAVLGTGVWLGVQHLGYLEFGELRRLAQRTVDQRRIFVNNLAIRRATEELRVTRDYVQLCRILEAAFSNNDFDGFDLKVELLPEGHNGAGHLSIPPKSAEGLHFHWTKLERSKLSDGRSGWNLTLDLVTASNRHRGSMNIYRCYRNRTLLVDINLLTSVFPVVLADALDCALSSKEDVLPKAASDTGFIAAEAS
jgi:hypothetical protein